MCVTWSRPRMEEGIAFNPGPDWSADPDAAANYIRLCFALPSVDDIWEGVAKLAEVFRQGGRAALASGAHSLDVRPPFKEAGFVLGIGIFASEAAHISSIEVSCT